MQLSRVSKIGPGGKRAGVAKAIGLVALAACLATASTYALAYEGPTLLARMGIRHSLESPDARLRNDLYEAVKRFKMPILDIGLSMEGGDKNSDGIRDDIGLFIEANFAGSHKRRAIENFAKTLRQVMLRAGDGAYGYSESMVCLFNAFAPPREDGGPNEDPAFWAGMAEANKVLDAVKSMTANTEARRRHWLSTDFVGGTLPDCPSKGVRP